MGNIIKNKGYERYINKSEKNRYEHHRQTTKFSDRIPWLENV